MKHYLKQSTEWATALRPNHMRNMFEHARLKLTFYYMGFMVVILLAFSSVLVYTIESKIREGFRDRIQITETDIDPIGTTSDDIETLIYIVDGILLVIIGFSSYFLAGKTLKPIRNALDAQKKFSADASHDLRTPLTIMTTESEVVLHDTHATESDLRRTIEGNLEETKKMSKLVHDLLLISRGDNQATTRTFTRVDTHDFVEKAVHKIEPQAKQKGLAVIFCPYKKIFITMDEDSFERALSNILQNAIKYTKKGSIRVDLEEHAQNIQIIIADTGVGIDPKDIPYVFDRFYKAEHSRNDVSSSGLGLSIAKLIVEEHRGLIQVKSTVGVGTEVVVTMPKSIQCV